MCHPKRLMANYSLTYGPWTRLGAGENLRGTLLGAVDTMSHEGMSKNDEIARQGRLEMERGMANMRGHGKTTSLAPNATTRVPPTTGLSGSAANTGTGE